jgi:hypothetical protein
MHELQGYTASIPMDMTPKGNCACEQCSTVGWLPVLCMLGIRFNTSTPQPETLTARIHLLRPRSALCRG